MISVFDEGPPEPCPEPFNLAEYVLRAGLKVPQRAALERVAPGTARSMSHAQLRTAVLGCATGLVQAGLAPGDRVLMRLGNTESFPIAFLGAIAAGIVPVPTSAQLTQAEISAICDDLEPQGIIHGPGLALPRNMPPVEITHEDLAGFRALAPSRFVMGSPERPAYVIFTSGTSGRAQGVVHAHRAIWARRMMLRHWYDLRSDDRLLHAGAFNWTYTLGTGLLDPWSMGATALIPENGLPSTALPSVLAEHRATIFAAAPGIYRQLLRAPLPPLPALRHGLSAGEKLPERIARKWHAATGCHVHEAYGMSECSTFVSACPARPAPHGAIGYPQPGRRLAIVDAKGNPVMRGEAGSVAIGAGDQGLMLHYLDTPQDTSQAASVLFRNGWFITGDTAIMAPDGSVRYLGRSDDMLNAGGYRVSPLEIETVMQDHPALTGCAACEVEIKADTRVIALFYTARSAVVEADLAAFAARHLARYKQPRLFYRIRALPTGANGKLQRHRLRKMQHL